MKIQLKGLVNTQLLEIYSNVYREKLLIFYNLNNSYGI